MGAAPCSRRAPAPAQAALDAAAGKAVPSVRKIGSGAPRTSAGLRASKTCSDNQTDAAASCPAVSAIRDCLEEEQELEKRRRANFDQATSALHTVVAEATLTKLRSIDGRLLVVLDNVFPEATIAQLFNRLEQDSFKRTEFARPDTRDFRHHVVEYNVDKFSNTPLYKTTDRLVQLFFSTRGHQRSLAAYRIYTNSVMYGDVAFVHRDSGDETHVTALIYPNPEWKSELGGETIFYYENGEVADAVEPRPGRLVLFHGVMMHKGSPPGRLFWGSRYTTAFKYEPAGMKPST